MRKLLFSIAIITSIFLPWHTAAQINTDQVLRVGQNALYFEDYMLSVQYFNQVITAKPYLAQPYFFRAIAKLNLDDARGAEEDATLALERNPYIADAYEVRGVARQMMGRLKDAISDYSHALDLLPQNRGILFNKALAEEELKDYESAKVTYSTLLKAYPRFANGYVGRAKLNLAVADTTNAISDLDKALDIDKNLVNAYILRADIALNRQKDYSLALSDMNEAIKLQPRNAGLFINRAFLRYNLDDYFGAMSDYDYAISLDPLNPVSYFNRGLLRAEVHDRDRAISDFSKVLEYNPDDYRSLYNRSMLYRETGNYNAALADLNKVVDAFPDFEGVLFSRFQLYDMMGRKKEAEKDYNRALALSKKAPKTFEDPSSPKSGNSNVADESDTGKDAPDALVTKRFATLQTVQNSHDIEREYNSKSIRGKVQDRNMPIELQPIFAPAYYASTTQLRETPYFIKEVDDLNATRALRFLLQVTDADLPLTDEDAINTHFKSIEDYTEKLAQADPRAIDYFGRGMDYLTIRNYPAAIKDFTKAIELSKDFTVAYMMRSVACRKNLLAEQHSSNGETSNSKEDFTPANVKIRATLAEIIADIDTVINLSPRMAFAYYNKGIVLTEAGDLTSGLSLFKTATELKPDFGEAYYNIGYIYMKLGQREKGVEALSKAGELGVLPSYNLLKRMGH